MLIKFLIGLLLVVVGGNLIFAVLFCIVLAKMVTADARATVTWRELCSSCSERLNIVSGLLVLFEPYVTSKEDEALLREAREAQSTVTQLSITPENYLEPKKSEKFQIGQEQFGVIITRLVRAMDTYPYLLKKHDYTTARSTLDACEERLQGKCRSHNHTAQTCNKLKNGFPGPLVATMMRFSGKAVLNKEFTKAREKFTSTPITSDDKPEEGNKPK